VRDPSHPLFLLTTPPAHDSTKMSWLLLCCLLNLVVMGHCTTTQEAKRYFEVIQVVETSLISPCKLHPLHCQFPPSMPSPLQLSYPVLDS
jgi:hypothetical protein